LLKVLCLFFLIVRSGLQSLANFPRPDCEYVALGSSFAAGQRSDIAPLELPAVHAVGFRLPQLLHHGAQRWEVERQGTT